ncbi:MAG: hypothetical protein US69_C0002G0089 [candidate division TM6 bacterium GW2011_GWF2_38_10]|nr:MAG: hypothetical protein US69_C0002G0089 [candidate division TM6 bacterium GW2011_GWF2_38_10]
MNNTLYQEELLEHFKYPRNKKAIANPSFESNLDNPSCGDKVQIQGIITNNVITDLGFSGSGCVISQAAASMLTNHCIGKTVDEVMNLTKDDIFALVGIKLGPTRTKCALLSLQVLQEGLAQQRIKKNT